MRFNFMEKNKTGKYIERLKGGIMLELVSRSSTCTRTVVANYKYSKNRINSMNKHF
jgi:hypothetical protein